MGAGGRAAEERPAGAAAGPEGGPSVLLFTLGVLLLMGVVRHQTIIFLNLLIACAGAAAAGRQRGKAA
ncbi:MAG TPA: hypothetical protein PKI19_02745 [Elusimicrobiales bacterium]|nr:hypothetical protein [Elusimicrobiales bacterium]